MLNLAIHKVILKHAFRAPTVDQERHWLCILWSRRTLSPLDTAVPRAGLVVQHCHATRTRYSDSVPDAEALNCVVCHRTAVNGDLGIVRPTSLTDVDRALDIPAKAGNGVVVYDDVGVVAFPRVVVDHVDACELSAGILSPKAMLTTHDHPRPSIDLVVLYAAARAPEKHDRSIRRIINRLQTSANTPISSNNSHSPPPRYPCTPN